VNNKAQAIAKYMSTWSVIQLFFFSVIKNTE
jgi:hypothetical protein